MDELDLKNAWSQYDKKLETLLKINFEQLKAIQTGKAESKINSFLRNHVLVMIFGIMWVLFLVFLIVNTLDNVFFAVSVGLIILFNVFAVALYIRHIVILNKIDIAESITETQSKLAQVHTSYTNVGRVLILQAPLYCTWWYSMDLVHNGGLLFWSINLTVVAFFTILSIYLFRKLSPNTRSDSWAKRVDKLFGAEKLRKAMSFLDEIETFKKENGA